MKLRLSGEPTFDPPAAEATPPRLWQQPFALCGIWLAGGLGVPIASLATAVVRALGVEAPEGFRSNHWAAGLALWLPSSALTIVVTLWWVRTLERRSLASAGLARASVRAQGRWALAGGLWALVLSVALLPLFGEPEDLVRPFREAARQAPLALAAMPLMLAIAAVPAMAEEVVYRGWLLSVLGLRVGPWAAVTVSSVVFACIHVAPVEWGEPARLASAAAYCAGGMALGAVAMAQGHVWGAAAFHITFNAVVNWMLLADLGFDVQEAWDASNEVGSEELSDALAWLALEAALAAALLRFWWTRRRTPRRACA